MGIKNVCIGQQKRKRPYPTVFQASSRKFFYSSKKKDIVYYRGNGSRPVINTHTEKEGSWSLICAHRATASSQRDRRRAEWACLWFSRMKYNKRHDTHTLPGSQKREPIVLGFLGLICFLWTVSDTGLCVYSHALFGLRRTTCAGKLWHG